MVNDFPANESAAGNSNVGCALRTKPWRIEVMVRRAHPCICSSVLVRYRNLEHGQPERTLRP